MNPDRIREAIAKTLGGIAPEADIEQLNPRANLRDELDLDSMDFLNFVIGLHKELGVEIPETDYAKLSTLGDCMAYLAANQK
jgi:acyl carrier protein